MIPLSVCLIARNEAHNLPRLMQSLQGVAAEVVLVDTGSDDGTPEMAMSLGARVLRTTWEDDFSKARNVALEAARHEWILSLDADQQFDRQSRDALALALTRNDCHAQIVTICLMGQQGSGTDDHFEVRRLPSIRLFRRNAGIRYRWPVHEDVADSLIEMGWTEWPDSGVKVYDHGYVDAGDRKRKLGRNLALLRKAHLDFPQALHLAYKLATSLGADDGEERQAVLGRALEISCTLPASALQSLACLPNLVAMAMESLVAQGRLSEAAEAAVTLAPRTGLPLCLLLGRVLAREGRAAEARRALMSFLEASARPDAAVDPIERVQVAYDDPAEACFWMAWLDVKEERFEEADRWIQHGRSLIPNDLHAGLELLAVTALSQRSHVQAACQALEQFADRAARVPGRLLECMPCMSAGAAVVALAQGDEDAARDFLLHADGAYEEAAEELGAYLFLRGQFTDEAELERHCRALTGRRWDTLAMKIHLTNRLGRAWPHPVGRATQGALERLAKSYPSPCLLPTEPKE